MPETIEGQPKAAQNVVKVPVPENIGGELKEGLKELVPTPEDFVAASVDLAPEQIVPVVESHVAPSFEEEINAIKDQVNSALSTVIEMVVGLEERFDTLDQRIVEFNRKGGHKL